MRCLRSQSLVLQQYYIQQETVTSSSKENQLEINILAFLGVEHSHAASGSLLPAGLETEGLGPTCEVLALLTDGDFWLYRTQQGSVGMYSHNAGSSDTSPQLLELEETFHSPTLHSSPLSG